MEYVAIPWQNNHANGRDSNELTMNLGLFLVHILAGNSHSIEWAYPALVEEELIPLPCQHEETNRPPTAASEEQIRRSRSDSVTSAPENLFAVGSKKRKRAVTDDAIAWSFRGSFQLPSQVSFFRGSHSTWAVIRFTDACRID